MGWIRIRKHSDMEFGVSGMVVGYGVASISSGR